MKLLLTGATGFVGKQIYQRLALQGHELIILARNAVTAKRQVASPHQSIEWSIEKQEIGSENLRLLRNVDAVISLAGEPIAAHRWNSSVKKKIYDSRVRGTQALIELLKRSG